MLSARGVELAVLLLGLVESSAAMDDFPDMMVSSSETISGTLLLVLAGLLAALRLL